MCCYSMSCMPVMTTVLVGSTAFPVWITMWLQMHMDRNRIGWGNVLQHCTSYLPTLLQSPTNPTLIHPKHVPVKVQLSHVQLSHNIQTSLSYIPCITCMATVASAYIAYSPTCETTCLHHIRAYIQLPVDTVRYGCADDPYLSKLTFYKFTGQLTKA